MSKHSLRESCTPDEATTFPPESGSAQGVAVTLFRHHGAVQAPWMSYPASRSCIELPACIAFPGCTAVPKRNSVPRSPWHHRRAAAVTAASSASEGLSGYRCQYCFNIDFSTPAKLARHIVVEHQAFVPDSQPQCPYCGASNRNRSALADHIRSGCDSVGQCTIPSPRRRRLSSEALAADPKYPLLARVCVDRAGTSRLHVPKAHAHHRMACRRATLR